MLQLHTLLRKLASISIQLNTMQNRQVAYYFASRVKLASGPTDVDSFVDLADTCAEYIAENSADFCPEDLQRLHVLGKLLRDANTALFNTQNEILGV